MRSPFCHRDDRGEIILYLPTSIWSLILEHLSLTDGRSLMQSSSILWSERKVLEAQRRRLKMYSFQDDAGGCRSIYPHPFSCLQAEKNIACFLYPRIHQNLTNLRVLDFGPYITDRILQETMHCTLPNLQELYLVGSNPSVVSDQGFLALGRQDPDRRQNLRYIDITGCDSISYYATILLRKRMSHPDLVIRRQPQWMDGHFQTPYARDGIHTYYADGSFLYDRNELNCGYVCDLWQWPRVATPNSTNPTTIYNPVALDKSSYGNSLYFINFTKPGHWPQWTLDFMYPGVTLLPNQPDKDGSRSVVVVQCMHGLLPPPVRLDHPVLQRHDLPIGISQYYNLQGELLLHPEGVVPDQAHQRVTRMRVYPLEDARFFPKPNVQDQQLWRMKSKPSRNCYMPPDYMVNAIQVSIEKQMIRNATERVVNVHPEWVLSKSAIRLSAQHVHQFFMGATEESNHHHEVTERYVNLIYRQKSYVHSSFFYEDSLLE